jgi:hypothetical protein
MVIRRVGVLSVAKVAGVLYAALGLIIGTIFALFAVLGSAALQSAAAEEEIPAIFGALFGVGAIIFFPILYGILGFVFIGILAALYNFVAGLVGGVVIDVQ